MKSDENLEKPEKTVFFWSKENEQMTKSQQILENSFKWELLYWMQRITNHNHYVIAKAACEQRKSWIPKNANQIAVTLEGHEKRERNAYR